MSEIGHSTLLKFFVDTSKMSEPSGKTESSIESKVPGEQPLRGDYIQELQENNVAVKDYSLSPVITVTKEESTFTKGDLKVQKVIVSEDISDETSNTNRKLITTESTSPTEVQTEIHSEVSSVTINTEGDTQKSTGDQKVVYKVTKIPKLKFKQAVDKIKNEEEMKREGKDEVELGLKVTETIPGLKDEKNLLQQLSRSESIQQDSPKVDDEFDRIYDEIFENGPPSGNFPSPEKIEDTDKLETKFDEIIHAYDEQKAQANAEKVKSKIPLLKRKSEHDIYAPRQTLRKNSLNKRNSIDDTKCKLPVPLIKEKQNVELVSSQKQKTVSAQNVTVFEIANTNISKSVTTASHQKDGEIDIMQKTEFNSTSSEVSKSKIPTHLKEIVAVKKASDVQTSEISPQFSIEKRNEDIFIGIVNKNETHEPETLISEGTTKTLNVRDNISSIKTEPLIITDNVEKDPNINDNNKKDITQNIIFEKDTGNGDQITETETPINDSPQNEKPLDATNSNNLDKLEKVPNINENNKNNISQNIIVDKDTGNRDQIKETETKTNIVTKVDDKNFKPINDLPQNEKPLDATNSNNDFHEKNNHSENNFSKIEVQKINVNETNSSVSIKQEVRETVEIVSNSDIKDIQHDQQDKVRDNITNIPKDILHISRSDVCLKSNSVHNNSLQEIIYDDIKTNLSGENFKRNDVINMNRENATIITERISSKIQSNASVDLSKSSNEIKSNNLSQEYTINKFPSKSDHISQKIITEVNNNEIKAEDIKVNKAIENIAIRNNKVNSSENNGKDINELEEEDVIMLKGKVNRIISRLDSREFKVNKCQLDDLPQEESVVSKIALFEQSKSIDTAQKASITKNKLEDEINVDKPKIVDEVLKFEKGSLPSDSKFSYNTFLNYKKTIKNSISVNENEIQATSQAKSMSKFDKIFKTNINLNKFNKTNENTVGSSEDEVFFKNEKANRNIINEYKINKEIDLDMRRAKSLAELNYDGVQGRVRQMVVRMNSIDKMALERREQNEVKRKTRHGSVSERIALFEKKVTPIRMESVSTTTSSSKQEEFTPALTEEELTKRITELMQARATYGHYDNMTYIELSDGGRLPSLVVGTALLDPPLIKPIIKAAIDLGYRAIDTAYVYGNEQAIGEAIREKIQDGTVKREDLFVLAKLWSTNHRHDLVSRACKQSLEVMGLDYFDLYLIHNPMSFKEGPNPLPKIANVLQYSEHDYLEAWFGIESLIKQGLVKRGGVSNFNSVQVERVLDKGKIKPVVDQVECHPYLSQARLQDYLSSRGVALSCFGCLGSSGTPPALRSSLPPVIRDPLVRTMAAGLGVTPAQLLLSYQLSLGRSVVVKASSAAHLWDDLRALDLRLAPAHAAGLAALNRNKRTFTFEGMGDTHKNYPFKIPF